jgi:hypothetical protein
MGTVYFECTPFSKELAELVAYCQRDCAGTGHVTRVENRRDALLEPLAAVLDETNWKNMGPKFRLKLSMPAGSKFGWIVGRHTYTFTVGRPVFVTVGPYAERVAVAYFLNNLAKHTEQHGFFRAALHWDDEYQPVLRAVLATAAERNFCAERLVVIAFKTSTAFLGVYNNIGELANELCKADPFVGKILHKPQTPCWPYGNTADDFTTHCGLVLNSMLLRARSL